MRFIAETDADNIDFVIHFSLQMQTRPFFAASRGDRVADQTGFGHNSDFIADTENCYCRIISAMNSDRR